MPTLEPVLTLAHKPELWTTSRPPWLLPEPPYPAWHLRLHGAMPSAEFGLAVAEMASSEEIPLDGTPAAVLARIVAETASRVEVYYPALRAEGGLQVCHGERVIIPGCCCDLAD